MSHGWHFPKKNDGGKDGFNDSGIETFQGAQYSSLAREVLQNSLDARAGLGAAAPVQVMFDVVSIKRHELPGVDELQTVMQLCQRKARKEKEKAFFNTALKVLAAPEILCLKIEDFGTTGADDSTDGEDSAWFALTKTTGESTGKGEDAGGSFGIGKFAPFTVSELRTVFYSTMYPAKKTGEFLERIQGKSILMSHSPVGDKGTCQGTGYYGIKDQCQPLCGHDNAPSFLRRDKTGTTLFIPAFRHQDHWAAEVAAIVLSNFFYAVHAGELEVVIDSKSDSEGSYCIEKGSLGERFSQLLQHESIKGTDTGRKLEHAKWYYDAITTGQHTKDTQDKHLGHCELFVAEGKGAPQKIAVIRNTGMLITDQMSGLKRFGGMPDFAGVLICRGKEGNALLRSMENPQHDRFEPDRLTQISLESANKGRKALRSIARWVRDELEKMIAPPASEEPTPIDELRDIIPNEDDETLSGEAGDGERDLSGGLVIRPRQGKARPKPPDPGGGKRGGGTDGTSASKISRPVRDFRILPAPAGTIRVSFVPLFDGTGVLGIHIAGDSDTEKLEIDKIEVVSGGVTVQKSHTLASCKTGERVVLAVTVKGDVFANGLDCPLAVELTKPAPKEKAA